MTPGTITPLTLLVALLIQSVGFQYLISLQFLGYVIARLCFLRFGTSHADAGSELGWQIARGLFWPMCTLLLIAANQGTPTKRLKVVQQRRYSINVRPCRRCDLKSMIWICMILNTHLIAAAQGPVWPQQEIFTTERTTHEQGTTSTGMDDLLDSIAHPRSTGETDFNVTGFYEALIEIGQLSTEIDCHRDLSIADYGHHLQYGACGSRRIKTKVSHIDDANCRACEIWMNIKGVQQCNACRTSPQSDGENLTFIGPLDYEDTNPLVVIVDIDPMGGIPRRHTAQLDRNEETGKIIRRLDRDRRCISFDLDHFSPLVFDHVSVFEVINSLDADDILFSVIAHFGPDFPRRIEVQAWQAPRRPTVQHLMALTCFWRFSQEQTGDPYIASVRQQYHDADTVIDIQRDGYYELLHPQLPSIRTCVSNLAQFLHRIDLEHAADTLEDEAMTPTPDGGRDEETSLIQGSTITADSDSEGISLIQKTLTLSTAAVLAHSGYTDIFLDRVWPLTTEGEQQMSPNIDPVDLRNRWQRVSDMHGIPRPVDVALIIICRPYHLGARTQELHLTLARFDDPTAIPQEVVDHWSDLSETVYGVSTLATIPRGRRELLT